MERVSTRCLTEILSLLLLVAARTVAAAEEPTRNARFDHSVIENLSLSPKREVREIGDRPGPPPGDGPATLTVHLRNPAKEDWRVRTSIEPDGDPIGPATTLFPLAAASVSVGLPVAEIPYRGSIVLRAALPGGKGGEVLDRALLHGREAHRVALLVERRTWESGLHRFGSFTRRFRRSLGGLHAVFDDPPEDLGAGLLAGERVADRFRTDHVEIYDREEDPHPALFDDHPRFGIVYGLWLNEAWAAGLREEATRALAWEDLRPVTGSRKSD